MRLKLCKTIVSVTLCVALLLLVGVSAACINKGIGATVQTTKNPADGHSAPTIKSLGLGALLAPPSRYETYAFSTALLFPHSVKYQALVAGNWQNGQADGTQTGVLGGSSAIEALSIVLDGTGLSGSIDYRLHTQNSGWQSWESDGAIASATDGSGKLQQIEALQIRLTDEINTVYNVYYRVHVAGLGWLGWAKDGETAGAIGVSCYVEALQIKLVMKNAFAPGSTDNRSVEVDLTSQAYVAGSGWLSPISGQAVVGTAGQDLRLEAFRVSVSSNIEGGIEYQALAQESGWLDWAADDTAIGSEGLGRRLEAIKIQLTGELAEKFDIYYRAHCEEWGWMGWAKNGEPAGTGNVDLQMEAFQIVIVLKGAPAPGSVEEFYMESYPLPDTQKYMNAIVAGVSSRTDWLIAIDPDNCVFGVYYGSQGNWQSIYFWICSPGAPVSPTPKGLFSVGSKGYVFGSGYSCYWYTQFWGDYLMHSLLHYPGTFTLMEDTLGRQASQGCVRLEINNAKWVYDNIPYGTAVYIY